MLILAKLDYNWWDAAVTAANYLRNLSPCAALDGKCPYEEIYKKKPKISHLRVLSCVSYPLSLTMKMTNLHLLQKRIVF